MKGPPDSLSDMSQSHIDTIHQAFVHIASRPARTRAINALDALVAEKQLLMEIVEIVARRRERFSHDVHRNEEEQTLDSLLDRWRNK